MKEQFLKAISIYVDEWDKSNRDSRSKLEGLASSILALLDGEGLINAYAVKPIDEKGNEGDDIAGNLHNEFSEYRTNK